MAKAYLMRQVRLAGNSRRCSTVSCARLARSQSRVEWASACGSLSRLSSATRGRWAPAATMPARNSTSFFRYRRSWPMKILVTDDDLELLELIGFTLRQAGYLIVEAADGEEALEMYRREQPDLVILDVNLPRMNGFEVCRHIRAESTTPIMLLTVRNDEDALVQGLDLGADDYLTKPFSPRTLRARVRAL